MKKENIVPVITVLFFFVLSLTLVAQPPDIGITIHLRGVYKSKITILTLTGSGTFKPVAEVQGIMNGETTSLALSSRYLPGEFVLRFDYKDKEPSTPYPAEKYLFIYNQDLELWVNPKYCNNADSTYFQIDERENSAFALFSEENGKLKEQLGVLQNFLMNYDDTGSKFYLQGIKEYEQKRQVYNQWLLTRAGEERTLFVSSLYRFQYVPETSWKGSETDRIQSLARHYFDGIDFRDTFLIRTSYMNKWMDGYVNLYGQLSTTMAIRDSLFLLAGKTAIEKARKGHPLVYGWMVDYFYRGYESNGIDAGMKILEPFLNDPDCMTSKRKEINRRLEGMKTLVAGNIAPGIIMKGRDSSLFDLTKFETKCRYILLLFWSAGCSHCVELTDKLYPWQQQTENRKKMEVIAISLDETETEIKAWEKKTGEMKGWKHLCATEGIRSKVAGDYFVLGTPVMVMLNAKTRKIITVPNTLDELTKVLQ